MVKTLHPLGPISSQIELPPEVRVRFEYGADRPAGLEPAPTVSDPAAATKLALSVPLHFPSLAEGVVPGDRLVIAIDEAVPEPVSILRGALEAAMQAGIAPDAIAVVTSDEAFGTLLRGELGESVRVVVHDPDDPENLCLIGLNEKQKPVRINRTIFEADVVLPIGCARLPNVVGSGTYDCLFPRLSDSPTIARYRTPSKRGTISRIGNSRRKADEVGWMLGVVLVIQVVPGAASAVAAIVAGEAQMVADRCQQLCEQLWSFTVPRQASLVIANVTGGPQEQNWENIARALVAIEPLVEEGGAVAICSDLETSPGSALSQLVGCSDFAEVEKNLQNDPAADGWPAWQLARALQRGPVYFLSQLEPEAVEDLGLAPIESLDDLARLAGRQQSCILLDSSQHTVATVAGSP